MGRLVIVLGTAAAALVLLAWALWKLDQPSASEWEALLSPEAEALEGFMRNLFAQQEHAFDWSLERAVSEMDRKEGTRLLAATAAYLADLIPERQALLRRLELYARAAPLPGYRVSIPRRALSALRKVRPPEAERLVQAREEFRLLDAEMLKGWRLLVASVRKE